MEDPVYKQKRKIRKEMREFLSSLPLAERVERETRFTLELASYCTPFTKVLSFASFHFEMNTFFLNEELEKRGALVLPRVEDHQLKLFLVKNREKELIKNSLGIYEPNPFLCKELPMNEIDLLLIPALAFDKRGHRIGYGKGMYDRLLQGKRQVHTIGVGFKEQEIEQVPTEPHDQPLSKVMLF